jgi:hypothetical protein
VTGELDVHLLNGVPWANCCWGSFVCTAVCFVSVRAGMLLLIGGLRFSFA